MTYDVDFFIDKVNAIPEERFIAGRFDNGYGMCMSGHCGKTEVSICNPPQLTQIGGRFDKKIDNTNELFKGIFY